MDLFLPILFGGGLIIYSAIGRWGKLFLIAQVVTATGFVALSIPVLKIGPDVPRGLALGMSFVIAGLAPRVAVRRGPIEVHGEGTAGAVQPPPVGIVDFVWVSLMATALTFTGFALDASPFVDPDPPLGRSAQYYETDFQMTQMLFSRAIDTILLLGGTLAAAMTILWAGEIWRRRDEGGMVYYGLTTRAAIQQVVAFFIVALSAFVWVVRPLYERMTLLRNVLP